MRQLLQTLACCLLAAATCSAAELPRLYADDFEHGMERWETTDPDPQKPAWEITQVAGFDGRPTQVLRITRLADYLPKHRSPQGIAWLTGVTVGDFDMTARVQSTNSTAGPHRDMCLFWGGQDADHFYYVHLGAQSDPNACQIFIVNAAPRTPITVKKATGTPWTDGWHTVKIIRRVEDGSIEAYFDDMQTPLMNATDATFGAGRVGLGTFDDHGNWDDFELRGVATE